MSLFHFGFVFCLISGLFMYTDLGLNGTTWKPEGRLMEASATYDAVPPAQVYLVVRLSCGICSGPNSISVQLQL